MVNHNGAAFAPASELTFFRIRAFMNMVTILVPVAIIALVLIGFFVVRSRRQERRARDAGERLRKVPTEDALTKADARVEPGLIERSAATAAALARDMEESEPRAAASSNGSAEEDKPIEHGRDDLNPSETPPVYPELEREEAERAESRRAERAQKDQLRDEPDRAAPPVDPAVEWVLDIAPADGMAFALGGVKSLKFELSNLHLPLLVRVFAQSAKDGLYYEADEITYAARHVVATLVLANRAAKLDDVSASHFYQVLEQSAAQSNVVIHRALEPMQAVQRSEQLRQFIDYFDRRIEVLISPADPEAPFPLETVSRAALAAGFEEASGRWELRLDPEERDPALTLAFGAEGVHELVLALDLPLASIPRGDLKRFFSLANQIAAAVDGVWTDCSHRPVDAGGAMLIAENVAKHARLMAEHGVVPGSSRAHALFSRS